MAMGLKSGEGLWRVHSSDGDAMYGPKKHMCDGREWLSRIGRRVNLSTHDSGSHSVLIDGKDVLHPR